MGTMMQTARELRRPARSVRFKQIAKRAIDLVDGTMFRARPKPHPGGPTSAFYQQHGYAIFRDAIDQQKINALKAALETEVIGSDAAFLRHKSVEREPNVFLAGTRIPNDGNSSPRASSAARSMI